MLYDYDGSGRERELCISAHTLMVYEQQFKRDMLKDVFGRITISEDVVDDDGKVLIADYTQDNWTNYLKALWAMLRSGADLARSEGRAYEEVPPFDEWSMHATNLDMADISRVVVEGVQRDLFRSGTAAAEEGAGGAE